MQSDQYAQLVADRCAEESFRSGRASFAVTLPPLSSLPEPLHSRIKALGGKKAVEHRLQELGAKGSAVRHIATTEKEARRDGFLEVTGLTLVENREGPLIVVRPHLGPGSLVPHVLAQTLGEGKLGMIVDYDLAGLSTYEREAVRWFQSSDPLCVVKAMKWLAATEAEPPRVLIWSPDGPQPASGKASVRFLGRERRVSPLVEALAAHLSAQVLWSVGALRNPASEGCCVHFGEVQARTGSITTDDVMRTAEALIVRHLDNWSNWRFFTEDEGLK